MPEVTDTSKTTMKAEASISNLKSIIEQHSVKLTVPNIPESFLSVKFLEETPKLEGNSSVWNGPTPFAESEIVDVKLIKCQRLTTEDPKVKKTLELSFEFFNKVISFQPGDSFGFICHNSPSEVEDMLKCLNILDHADFPCEIQMNEVPNQKRKKIPSHIPVFSTLRHIFTECVDIRAIPKKIMLRVLSSYCNNEVEKQVLQFLCSREGSSHYTELIVEHMMTLIDLLQSFPSCCPPAKCLIEHLPPLKPRFYSVASSPFESSRIFKIVLNVIEIKKTCECCRNRKGVCTGWLERLSEEILQRGDSSQEKQGIDMQGLTCEISSLTLEETNTVFPQISIYKRKNPYFKLPEDPETPVIMIGPGTGLAPFIGFLHHREQLRKNCEDDSKFGEMWLLYGCRYKEKDFLYREDLNRLLKCKVLTNLLTCFSRDDLPDNQLLPRHVQYLIKLHAESLVRIIENGAVVYVCGDARNMVKNVRHAFVEAFKDVKNLSESEAEVVMNNISKEGRYLTDVWI